MGRILQPFSQGSKSKLKKEGRATHVLGSQDDLDVSTTQYAPVDHAFM
jgi:hypothetical protein